ncbi:MAG: TIR domain-containing protein [Blautia sp.]|nr:TIR domain-containing protein [Blautia sp.]
MAVFKCKMCGGNLEVQDGMTVCECEYCGSIQAIPANTDDNLRILFNRANVLRMKAEFDKAEEIYEKILQISPNEAEAYWGLILCKYGVEYVEDPKTLKRVPTCHRTSYDAIVADDDYKNAIENADISQKILYEEEARTIDQIQKGILSISQKEEPYDVFICYKETDESGKRTQDGVIANDIYYQLSEEGYKVFYAAITLEDKLGTEYEPYIFAALNTARVMLVLGTKPEYFNAVWVKNEWSRFLAAMKKNRSKLLIPCYKDMDPYELPDEFSHLQAQDMSKIGFINDVIRGIKKIIVKKDESMAGDAEEISNVVATEVLPLLKRAEMFLEDQEWKRADELCEKVLNSDPENARAYLYKLMAELQVANRVDLKNCKVSFENSNNYKKVIRFADQDVREKLTACINFIKERNETDRKNKIYNDALQLFEKGNAQSVNAAVEKMKSISGWKDSDEKIKEFSERYEVVVEKERVEKEEKKRIERLKSEYDRKYSALIEGKYENQKKLKEIQKKLATKLNKRTTGVISSWTANVFGIIAVCSGLALLFLDSVGNGIIEIILGGSLLWLGISSNKSKKQKISDLEQEKSEVEKVLKDIEAIPSLEKFIEDHSE